jgi:hypothetical protein
MVVGAEGEQAVREAAEVGSLPIDHPIYAAEHGGSAAPSYGVGREFEPRRCNANLRSLLRCGNKPGWLTDLISRSIGEFESPSRYFHAGVRPV